MNNSNLKPPVNRYRAIMHPTGSHVLDTKTGRIIIPSCYSFEHAAEEAGELNERR